MTKRVVYVLDASGSMSMRVKQTVDLTKASIAKLKDSDRVSLITFEGSDVNVVFKDVNARDVAFGSKDYRIGAMTNLLDAVHDGCELIRGKAKDTQLVVVLTDGAENSSRRVGKKQLAEELKKLQDTDRWTFAWMVPPECVSTTRSLGIDPSNILAWTDIEAAAVALSLGMDNLAKAEASGKTSLRNGFFANLDGVAKKDIRKEMTDVSAKVQRATVKAKMTIKEFCDKHFGGFVKGNAMYELTEPETVQEYKEVALIDKRRPTEIFLGGRSILGLPNGTVRLKPGNLGNYRAFIGSTSVNRNTDPGTEILFGPGIAKTS